jgi:hypothetical protein
MAAAEVRFLRNSPFHALVSAKLLDTRALPLVVRWARRVCVVVHKGLSVLTWRHLMTQMNLDRLRGAASLAPLVSKGVTDSCLRLMVNEAAKVPWVEFDYMRAKSPERGVPQAVSTLEPI